MFLRKVSYFAVLGCLIRLFAVFGSPDALALAVGMVLIPVVYIPMNLHHAKRVRIHMDAEPTMPRGGTVTVRLTAENTGGHPVCRLRVVNLLTDEVERITLEGLSDREITLESHHCGRLKISLEKLRLYDCFGLIGVPVKCREHIHVTVQPEMLDTEISILPSYNSTDDAEIYAPDRPGWDLTETYQLRDYVPGDSPRQIHWKLSGKFDRLIVRDPGLPIRQDVLVFWERTGSSKNADGIDAEASAVVSVCRGLLEQSVRFRLGWNDGKENRCVILPISDLDELIGALPRLLSAQGIGDGDTGAGLLLHTQPQELCSHMIYVANAPAPEVLEWESHGIVTVLNSSEDLRARLAFLQI